MSRDPLQPGSGSLRLIAGVAGLAAVVATLGAAAVTIFACFVASEVPDAFDVSAEWASSPNTWGETFELVGIATVIAAITGALAAVSFALLHFAFRGRKARRGSAALVVLVPTSLAWLAICGTLFVNRGDAHLAVECDGYRFNQAAFSASVPDRWDHEARGLASCRTLIDRTPAQVRKALGAPAPTVIEGGALRYHDGGLVVYFSGGVVVDVVYSPIPPAELGTRLGLVGAGPA